MILIESLEVNRLGILGLGPEMETHMSNEEYALNKLLTAEFEETEVVIPTRGGQGIANRPVKVTVLKSKPAKSTWMVGPLKSWMKSKHTT